MPNYLLVLLALFEVALLTFLIRTSRQRTPLAMSPDAARTLWHAESVQHRIRNAA